MRITKLIKLTDAAMRHTINIQALATVLNTADPAAILVIQRDPPQTSDTFISQLNELGIPTSELDAELLASSTAATLAEHILSELKAHNGRLPIISEEHIPGDEAYKNRFIGELAVALNVDEIQLWSRSHGFFTADPRIVEQAFTISELSYEEALELGHAGARALCPPLLAPARDAAIPIRIVSAVEPDGASTLIHRNVAKATIPVTGFSSISAVALLRLEGTGLLDSVGMAERVFRSLALARISILFISQTVSEHSISIAVAADKGEEAQRALQEEFSAECEAKELAPILAETDSAVVAVTGENMLGQAGVSAKLFHALGQNGINIRAIAQGSSERNISLIVAKRDEAKALNTLHDAFFLSPMKTVHLFLIGTGQVGATLLTQIKEQREVLAARGVQLRVVCLANSRKMLFNEQGIDLDNWAEAVESVGVASRLQELIDRVEQLNLSNSIFIDCTASEEVARTYEQLLSKSISVVTPNKKAHSGTSERYHTLRALASNADVKFYYETTVGAGLPVIGTLHDLLASGDQVQQVEAVLSGTLSYLFNSFTGEIPFSAIVREARERGFTEPDPRDDLSGTDVARKLLILSREIGWPLELDTISVESLVPECCEAGCSVEAFLDQLEDADAEFEARRAQAAAEDSVLRYIGRLRNGEASVSLQAVSRDHPFYQLSGSDNIIAFSTQRYLERPLVVQGPGAGTEVTAAGVLADVLRVVSYLE